MKTIEEIIVEKEFNELTQEELSLVAELAENEQEYRAMRSLFTQLENDIVPESKFVASEATKHSLDNIFMAKHPVIAQEWKREEEPSNNDKVVALYNRTWFRAAAVLLLFSGTAYYYMENSEVISEEKAKTNQPQIAMTNPNPSDNSHSDRNEPSKLEQKNTVNTKSVQPFLADEVLSSDLSMEDVAAPVEDISTKDKSGGFATPSITSGSTTYSWSSPRSTGINADLYPDGIVTASGEVSKTATDGDQATSDVSTTEMLDWIQTVY